MSKDHPIEFDEWADAIRARPFDFDRVTEAEWKFQEIGVAAVPFLCHLLGNDEEDELTRIRVALLLGRTECSAHPAFGTALKRPLADPDAGVTRAALRLVGRVRAPNGVELIVPFLNDNRFDADAWWLDDCTVAHAAQFALELTGTPEAIAILCSVMTEDGNAS